MDPALAACGSRARWFTRNPNVLEFIQTCLHPLKCGFAVGTLRSALCSCNGNTGGAMHQPHACFDFIAMLPAWPTGNNELEIAIVFK